MDYQLRLPEYLAKCINKDKPELHCNGQCVLMQKIKEKEKKETKEHMLVYEFSAYYVHKEYTLFDAFHFNEESRDKVFIHYLMDYSFNYYTSIFRPPVA